jgi:hypothetical protein
MRQRRLQQALTSQFAALIATYGLASEFVKLIPTCGRQATREVSRHLRLRLRARAT